MSTIEEVAEGPERVSFLEAFLYWLKLGFISFGGPAGQIALMHRILVEEKRWIGENRFLHALNYCMLLPGPEAMQLATYAGWKRQGMIGGLIWGGLFVLLGSLVIMGLAFAVMWSSAFTSARIIVTNAPPLTVSAIKAETTLGPTFWMVSSSASAHCSRHPG